MHRFLAPLAFLLLVASPVLADVPFGPEQGIIGGIDGASAVTAGDLNGDGVPDVFGLAEPSSQLRYALNGGDGSSWAVTNLPNGSRPRQTDVGDLDGDGDLDLVYSNWNSREVLWIENDLDGTGTFLAAQRIVRWGRPDGVFVADVDGDADLDVVVANRLSDTYFWQENLNGDGSSWAQRTIGSGIRAQVVWAGDLDGDGDTDVVGAAGGQVTLGPGSLSWFENTNGAGTAWTAQTLQTGGTLGFVGVTAADIDRDGDLDIVVQDQDEGSSPPTAQLEWWENTAGDGSTWTEHNVGSIFQFAGKGLQAADLDLDGDFDLVGPSDGSWFENINGDGSGWTKRYYESLVDPVIRIDDTDVVDVDGDGDLDILGANRNGDRISWWENLSCSPGDPDADGDGVLDGCDVCPGSDDSVDSDGDGVPDGCDVCPGGDDVIDTDGDGTPNDCQAVTGSVSVDDVTAAEGDSGTSTFTFTVTLAGTVSGGFTVPYSTVDGSATTTDGDYVATAGTLTFAGTDGETQTIAVTVNGDTTVEGDETFTVELGTPSTSSVSVADGSGLGTIVNDDLPPAFLSIDDVTANEGLGTTTFTFTVTLSGTAASAFTVGYQTNDGSATTADGDYTAETGTLSFAGTDGETQTININVNGDGTVEDDETFTVTLGTPTASNVSNSDGSGLGTILNDDSTFITIDSVSQVEGDSGTTGFTFTVLLHDDVSGGFTVPYSTSDGSATTADGDYTSASGTLTFSGAEDETQTVTVSVTGDTVVEADETFTVNLGTPSNSGVTVREGTGEGTIQNDDSATLAIDDVSQLEGDSGSTAFTFSVTLSGEVSGGFTVPYSTTDGSATTADGDYTSASGTLTFSGTSGETETVTVSVTGDTVVEADEAFTVNLGTPSNPSVTASDGTGQGTIENDDVATLAIGDVAQAEGDAGATAFSFTVTLSGGVPGGFTVPYSTSDGSATTADGDYTAASGTLTFSGTDGETETVTVSGTGDTVVEADEGFTVTLGTPSSSSVTVSDGTGQGTIQNDDSATLAIDDVIQAEGDSGTTAFSFTVTLSGDVDGGFTVPYSTSDGSATTADGDYTAASGTLTFSGTDGETETVTVSVNGDTIVEFDESFTVSLGTPSNANVTSSDGAGIGAIENDDSATLAIDDVSQVEGDSGTTAFSFTVTLSGDVSGGVTVPYSTSDGSATTADGDYTAASGSLTFSGTDGETETVTVSVNGDTIVEADESFTVSLGTPSPASVTVSDGTGLGTIQNDDSATVAINDVSQLETDSGTTGFVFTMTLAGDVDGGFTVPFSSADGTATTAGSDYTATSGTLTFAGTDAETQTITVTVTGDTLVEADEAFTVSLGAPSNPSVTASDGTGQGTIQNDDSATVAIDDVSQVETDSGTTGFVFTVTLAGDVDGGFTVPFSSADGSATTADGDYTATSGTLTFAGTDAETQTITVTVTGDTVVEADEAFTIALGAASNPSVTASDGTGQGTIENDDSATVAIDDVAQAEGDAGASTFTLTVTLSGEVSGGFTVPYSTADGTATTADGDYTAASGTLTFSGTDGETQTISVDVTGDTVVEPDETFTVELGTPSNASVTASDGAGEGTIENDDSATLAIDDVAQAEGDAGTSTFTLTETLSGEVSGGFTVPYSTADGTATTADGDYTAASGTLTFSGTDGETQTISVDVTGDTAVEPDETFTVELGTPSNASVTASDGAGEGTIENDDSATLAIDDVAQAEGDAGTSTFTLTVTLSGEVSGGFTVPYSTADGTATTADGDYTAASGTLTFSGTDGETQTISVDVTGDTVVEPDETFTVELGTPSNASVTASDGTGEGTIENDDSASIAIDDVSQAEGDAGTSTFTLTVTLSGEVSGGFTVPYSTADGTATTADGDYPMASGTLTFSGTDGETQTISVEVIGDPVVEPDETFTVELGTPSNASVTVSDGTGQATLENDDAGALLAATKQVVQTSARRVTYEILISNVGGAAQADDPATDELEDFLPPELELISAESDSAAFVLTADPASGAVLGNGTIGPGEIVSVLIEATILADTGADVTNQALVRFDADHDGANDTTAPSDDPTTPEVGDATVFVVGALPLEIPTASGWGLLLLSTLLAAGAVWRLR